MRKALCDELGIEIKPKTNTAKVFGFLKKATQVGYKTAITAGKILDSFDEQPSKRRRGYRRKNRKSWR